MSNLINTTALSGTAPFGTPSIPVGTVAPIEATPAKAQPKASKAKAPSDTQAKHLAMQAFNENAQGGKLIGTAEQRISYAVAIHQANMVAARLNVPALSGFLDNKADKEVIVGHMRKHLLGDKPETKELDDKQTMEANDAFRAKSALLDRGMKIAAIVAKYKGTWEDFRPTANAWMVAPKAFLDKGETLTGHSLTAKHVMLGSGLVAFKFKTKSGGDKTDNRSASVSAMFRFNTPPTAKRTTGGTQATIAAATVTTHAADILKVVKPIDLANNTQLPVLVAAVHVLLCGTNKANGKTEKPSKPLIGTDYTNEFWKDVQDILRTFHEATHSPAFKKRVDGENPHKAALDLAAQA